MKLTKCTSTSTILIAFAVLIVNVLSTDNVNVKNNIRGSVLKISDKNVINAIVKTNDSDGQIIVKSKATKIRSTIDRLGIMSITTSYENMIYLRDHASIERVEIDYEVSAVSTFSERISADSNVRGKNENVPWGIMEVLQDIEFWKHLDNPDGMVKLCIADTGYEHGHADLPTKKADVFGSNNPSIPEEDWSRDENGHGTHVAGIIAATGGNSIGSVGIFPDSMGKSFEMIIGKAFNKSAVARMSDIMNAVEGCYQNEADVISLSLGNTNSSDIVREFFDDVYNHDVIIFAEAGDNASHEKRFPASYSSVVSVGAVGKDRERSSFSQHNDQVEISAPGESIFSTYKDNSYATMDGTSMATAHVAAVAALLRLYFPVCTNTQIRNVLAKTALDIDSLGCDENTGYGLVQAKNAYELLEEGECGGDIGDDAASGGCSELYSCDNDVDCNDDDPCTYDICMVGYCSNEISCDLCGLVPVQLDITTNKYPSETTWDIIDTNSTQRIMGGGPYDESSTNYSSMKCLDAGSYALTVYDSFGDGLVCRNVENSGYSLLLDNKRHAAGKSFKSKEEIEFHILGEYKFN